MVRSFINQRQRQVKNTALGAKLCLFAPSLGSADKTTDTLKSHLQRKDVNKGIDYPQFQDDLGRMNGGITQLLLVRIGKDTNPDYGPRKVPILMF